MAVAYEIPLIPAPQTLGIQLNGTQYTITLHWCAPIASWVLDVADGSGNALVSGVAVVTGADLLEQLAYLGIGGSLVAQTDTDPYAVPTFANLGEQSHLFFIS